MPEIPDTMTASMKRQLEEAGGDTKDMSEARAIVTAYFTEGLTGNDDHNARATTLKEWFPGIKPTK
jgi:hypothetical protein